MTVSTRTVANEPSIGRAFSAGAVFLGMLLAALALWTLIPLGWVWIGSQISDTQFPAETPYAVVAVGITISIVIDAWLLGRLNRLYVRLTYFSQLDPRRPSWLKSMRESEEANGTSPVEAALIASALLATAAFVLWFFLLASSPVPRTA